MADTFIELNFNEVVLVKLTEVGKSELRRRHEALVQLLRRGGAMSDLGEPYVLDENGYWRVQLWMLMNYFGPLCGIGQAAPFDAIIRIPVSS